MRTRGCKDDFGASKKHKHLLPACTGSAEELEVSGQFALTVAEELQNLSAFDARSSARLTCHANGCQDRRFQQNWHWHVYSADSSAAEVI